jgi:HEXXH motif-containing protein
MVPVRPSEWVATLSVPIWNVAGNLSWNFERADQEGTIAVGTEGAYIEPSIRSRNWLLRTSGRCLFTIEPGGISIRARNRHESLCVIRNKKIMWHWAYHPPAVHVHLPVTVGATLVYDKDRQPCHVRQTDPQQIARIGQAWRTIHQAWPQGHELLTNLTSRIVPLKARGVVSFSYRHRPGLSFINCFDRDDLDLIDDLIHENSHHHLNLLLRKYVLYHGDHSQQIFYSPWRRSLRPLRGILHATFTFTMGAILFERLSAWSSGSRGMKCWGEAGLTARDLQRARFRCLEELESVRYSVQDLEYADRHLGWLTGSGRRLIRELVGAIEQVEEGIAGHRKAVLSSEFGSALRRHIEELKKARQTYGPVLLSKA